MTGNTLNEIVSNLECGDAARVHVRRERGAGGRGAGARRARRPQRVHVPAPGAPPQVILIVFIKYEEKLKSQ